MFSGLVNKATSAILGDDDVGPPAVQHRPNQPTTPTMTGTAGPGPAAVPMRPTTAAPGPVRNAPPMMMRSPSVGAGRGRGVPMPMPVGSGRGTPSTTPPVGGGPPPPAVGVPPGAGGNMPPPARARGGPLPRPAARGRAMPGPRPPSMRRHPSARGGPASLRGRGRGGLMRGGGRGVRPMPMPNVAVGAAAQTQPLPNRQPSLVRVFDSEIDKSGRIFNGGLFFAAGLLGRDRTVIIVRLLKSSCSKYTSPWICIPSVTRSIW